jgi:hypothetical protein
MKRFLIPLFVCLALAPLASALPICTTGDNLQQYITAGGCIYGDLLFSNFVYQNNQIAGTPNQIPASAVTIVMANPNSFSIQAGWQARDTQELQVVWNYTVSSFTSPISSLGSSYALSGPDASALSVCQTNCPGSPLTFSSPDGSHTTVALAPNVNPGVTLTVQNTATLGPSSSLAINHVSLITNEILQSASLPEPGTVTLLIGGILGLALKRLRKS